MTAPATRASWLMRQTGGTQPPARPRQGQPPLRRGLCHVLGYERARSHATLAHQEEHVPSSCGSEIGARHCEQRKGRRMAPSRRETVLRTVMARILPHIGSVLRSTLQGMSLKPLCGPCCRCYT